jgi:transposase-like protein
VARLEASGDYRAIIQAWLNAVRRLSFVILPACALMFIVRRELIVTLFTEAYADSAPIFSIYLVVLLTQVALTSSIMRSIADFRYFRLKFNLIQIPLAGVTLYAGVQIGGLLGAITAAVCLNVFDVVVCVTAICHKLGVKRKDLIQLAPVANAAPAVIVAMIASSAVKTLIAPGHPIVILGASAAVFAFIYLVGALLFGALTPEDKDAIYKRALRLSTKFTFLKIPKTAAAPETSRLNQLGPRMPVSPASPVNRRPHLSETHYDITAECKARAVLQVLQEAESAARICRELQIDESLLSDWKEQFMKQAGSIFEKGPPNAGANERIAELERMVGRLKRELESERIAELERLVGRLMLELEESKKAPGAMNAPARRNGKPWNEVIEEDRRSRIEDRVGSA